MKKNKYGLSKAGVDELMDRLNKIANDINKENIDDLLEAQITSSFVKSMTKVKDMEDVIERNDQLTKSFRGLLDMYGFETMYDMYVYAKSCDVYPEEMFKAKDYSKLVPVKRKIIRNGKETEVTVYENPNKDKDDKEDQNADESSTRGTPRARRRHARELKRDMKGEDKSLNPKHVAELKMADKKMSRGNKPFQETSEFYLVLRDEDGNIQGIVGYSTEGQYLKMDFFRSSGEVSGIAARGFTELIKLALKKKKGVKVDDQPEGRQVFLKFKMKQEGQIWSISYKDLQSSFGDVSNYGE
ncbi:hypothetical protein 015DV002_198 [Bacillus phage 015DV002]|nr:hypothetical protein 015DV002_198 [Bacillus phage 015DV002]